MLEVYHLGCEHHNCAESFYEKRNHKKAMPHYQKTIDILESLSNDSAQGVRLLAMSYEGLGDCKQDISSFRKAEGLYRKFIQDYNTHEDVKEVASYLEGVIRKMKHLNTSIK